jgi:hypothetical protein
MILSRVTPYRMDVVPDELLPTIPPIIQRLEVGPKNNPCGFKQIKFVPYSGLCGNCFLTGSKAMILVKYWTHPQQFLPTVCPAKEVPAVLGISEILCWLAK